MLLNLTGYRQIKKAIELLGVKKETSKIIGMFACEWTDNLELAYQSIKEKLNLASNLDIIEEFSTKRDGIIKKLKEEGYQNALTFSDEEIEKAILQKVALLSLES